MVKAKQRTNKTIQTNNKVPGDPIVTRFFLSCPMAVSCDPLKLWRRLLALLPPWGSLLGLPHPSPPPCYGHTGCHPSRPSPWSSRKLAPVLVTGHAGILHWSHQFSGLSLPLGSFLREYNKHILTHFLNFPCAAHTRSAEKLFCLTFKYLTLHGFNLQATTICENWRKFSDKASQDLGFKW